MESLNEILLWVDEGILIDWFYYFPLHYAFAEYWLSLRDYAQAHQHASLLCELAARPPERTYLALGHCLLARIAMAQHNLDEAYYQASQGLNIVENAEVPLAAWRVHTLFAELESLRGQSSGANKHQRCAKQVIYALADSLDPDSPLRSCLLSELLPDQVVAAEVGDV